MFWDNAWLSHWSEGRHEQLRNWLVDVERLVTIEIGAGTAIKTVRQFGQRQKGSLIRINLDEPNIPSYKDGVPLKMGGLEGLQQIEASLRQSNFYGDGQSG